VSRRLHALVAGVLLAAGCGGGGSAAIAPPPPPPPPIVPGTLHGSVEVTRPRTEQVLESEPNDSLDGAHYLGEVAGGRRITVLGRADGSDPIDGYRLLAEQRVKVTVTLEFDAAAGDLDLGVWDFTGLQYVEVFAEGVAPEAGVFYAKGAFDLVVAAASGGGDYFLTIEIAAPEPRIPTREPDAPFHSGRYVGELLIGDAVECAGTIDESVDFLDSVVVSCPFAVRLRVQLAPPITGLPNPAEFDAIVYDLTSGAADPPELAYFVDGGEYASGFVEIPAGSLVQIYAFAYSGSDTFHLFLNGFQPAGGASAPSAVAVAPRDAERYPTGRVPADAFALYGMPSGEFASGEAIVRARRGSEASVAPELLADGCVVREAVPGGATLVEVPLPPGCGEEEGARGTLRAIAGLLRRGSIEYAEPNRIRRAMATPNDTFFNLQWHYGLLNLPAAWDITTGSNDVIVAVIDTGQTNHPDLAGRQIAGYDFISSAANARDGDGLDPDPTDPGDLSGGTTSSFHGTHVAGTIGAATNNGTGVAGVTWQTRIMHLRTLGRFGGEDFDIANAIRYAARLPNASGTLPAERAHVINMSLGGTGTSQTLQDAVTAARDAGVAVFASAGNSNSSEPMIPASLDGVISVAAVNIDAQRAYYSSFGPTVDLAAPGGDSRFDKNSDGWPDGVLSTLRRDGVTPPEDTYVFYQGTSMACPHAAGVAALLLALDPTLTPQEIEDVLTSTAVDLGAAGRDDLYGHGLIDARAALVAVQAANTPPTPPALAISNGSLVFQPGDASRRVTVANVGGERLLVDDPVPTTQSGAAWLSATRVVNPDPEAASDTIAVDIAVDATGLADGLHSGSVHLTSNGGSRFVLVLLRVSNLPEAPPDVSVVVRVVNVDTGAIAAQTTVNPATTLAFSLKGLQPGRYRLEAGTDDDGDGVLFEPGELGGAYPLRNAPNLIQVNSGDVRGPFEFVVGPIDTGLGN